MTHISPAKDDQPWMSDDPEVFERWFADNPPRSGFNLVLELDLRVDDRFVEYERICAILPASQAGIGSLSISVMLGMLVDASQALRRMIEAIARRPLADWDEVAATPRLLASLQDVADAIVADPGAADRLLPLADGERRSALFLASMKALAEIFDRLAEHGGPHPQVRLIVMNAGVD